jgi:large subunit ribosomal protein L14
MKGVSAKINRAIPRRAILDVCDNSGAKLLRFISVKGGKTSKGRIPVCGVGDFITCSVIKGNQEMRKQVVNAIVVRQKKEYRRRDGMRIKFEDNAAVVLKDDKGNPKGTLIKGPIAKEVASRWSAVSKIANIIV